MRNRRIVKFESCYGVGVMNVEKYHLKSESKFTRFEFISEGPKGAIRKLIEFQETTNPDIYNLAFGDFNNQTQEVDDLAISDNRDTEKILATVVSAVYTFFLYFNKTLTIPTAE